MDDGFTYHEIGIVLSYTGPNGQSGVLKPSVESANGHTIEDPKASIDELSTLVLTMLDAAREQAGLRPLGSANGQQEPSEGVSYEGRTHEPPTKEAAAALEHRVADEHRTDASGKGGSAVEGTGEPEHPYYDTAIGKEFIDTLKDRYDAPSVVQLSKTIYANNEAFADEFSSENAAYMYLAIISRGDVTGQQRKSTTMRDDGKATLVRRLNALLEDTDLKSREPVRDLVGYLARHGLLEADGILGTEHRNEPAEPSDNGSGGSRTPSQARGSTNNNSTIEVHKRSKPMLRMHAATLFRRAKTLNIDHTYETPYGLACDLAHFIDREDVPGLRPFTEPSAEGKAPLLAYVKTKVPGNPHEQS